MGGTRISSDCTTKYTCKARKGQEPKLLSEELMPCHKDATCQGVDGVMTCKCGKGLVGDGITECRGRCSTFRFKFMLDYKDMCDCIINIRYACVST